MNIKLKPFNTPNFVLAEMPPRPRQEGFRDGPSWALKEVDTETLSRLCDDFRAEVFRKAEKADPKKKESK